MILLHVKQNKTKLSKKCHPYNTRIGLVTFHIYERQLDWWEEQNRCIYVLVKTTGAWYSLYMLQHVTAEVKPRLVAQVNSAVCLDIAFMVSITFSHITSSSALVDIWQSTFHTPVCSRSCRPARCLSSSTHGHISERCLATALRASSSITTGHYILDKDVDPKRLGSENDAMKEAQQAHT